MSSDNPPIRICFLLLHIPVPSETFVINEILALQYVGVDVYTVALGSSQSCHQQLMERIINPIYNLSDYIAQQKCKESPFYSAACKLAVFYNITPELAAQAALAAEYMLSCAISHIHSHFASEAALVSLLVSKLTGIPFSFTAHAYDIFRLGVAGERNPNRRVKMLVENAANTITISEFNKKHILAITDHANANKLKVIHCGIDLERFKKIERKSANRVTFLSVGRLVEKKGHEYLLRAFNDVLETCDVQLRIIGEGDLRPILTALVEELDIADRVTFVGAVSSDVVLNEMQKADVFVLHSITGSDGDKEGLPVSIMEACASGLPVVSTRHTGIPELIVEGVSGFLVNEKDSQGFAEAMRTLAFSPELRAKMGLAGHTVVAEDFNILREAQKLKDVFTVIIEESSTKLANKPESFQVEYNLKSTSKFLFNVLNRTAKNIINRLFNII